jgi:serine/threonine protein kinase
MNHPNVLHAYDIITDDNCYYVVTNYCSNKTLEDYIK